MIQISDKNSSRRTQEPKSAGAEEPGAPKPKAWTLDPGPCRSAGHKQMRSRPATRTALFLADIPFALPRAGRGQLITGAFRRTHSQQAGQNRPAKITLRHLLCNTTVASGQSCRLWRTLLRRPQRPGNPSRIHRRICVSSKRFAATNQKRFWGTLPAIHPRESPGSASSAVMLGKTCRTSARL